MTSDFVYYFSPSLLLASFIHFVFLVSVSQSQTLLQIKEADFVLEWCLLCFSIPRLSMMITACLILP